MIDFDILMLHTDDGAYCLLNNVYTCGKIHFSVSVTLSVGDHTS